MLNELPKLLLVNTPPEVGYAWPAPVPVGAS